MDIPVVEPPPAAGLAGNSNYYMACGCQYMGEWVTVSLQAANTGFVASNGFGLQVNCYSAGSVAEFAQQYVISQMPGSSAFIATVENWTGQNLPLIDYNAGLANLSQSGLPGNYALSIALAGDSAGRIAAVQYEVMQVVPFKSLGQLKLSLLDLKLANGGQVTSNDLAPIVAFQANVVGWANGYSTTFTSGEGFIRYTNAPYISPHGTKPACVDWDYATAENSNLAYRELDVGNFGSIIQGVYIGASTAKRRAEIVHTTHVHPPR